MRIAQVSPIIESVPPLLYGGTERVVSTITEQLVPLGHDVTLFASADSRTSARLIPCSPRALRLDPRSVDPLPHYMMMLDQVRRHAHQFDLIHFHIDYVHFPLMRELPVPHVTTRHGRQDLWDLDPLFAAYGHMPLVSISDSQRRPHPDANWVATVYHGLSFERDAYAHGSGGYLAFLGRVSPEKRLDRAIEIASMAKRELVIAAKVDRADHEYFETCIKPLLDRPNVRFVGEVGDAGKVELLGGAVALLFPIDWPEPFGLAMIEAMACGTPVIGWNCGSVPEIIDDGVTGRIVESMEGAIAAVNEVASYDRLTVRRRFEERFSAERMVRDYLQVYEQLAGADAASISCVA
ncbi:MAG TPA: glycosyltransferase family 4 protein [Burkholderiales bacterium]|nr:glycosyltransferase family 4 protein [Burkholderiales bacterium]